MKVSDGLKVEWIGDNSIPFCALTAVIEVAISRLHQGAVVEGDIAPNEV